MKAARIEASCACGKDLEFKVKKPKAFQPNITKVLCHGCGSSYLVHAKKQNGDVNLSIQNNYLSDKLIKFLKDNDA